MVDEAFSYLAVAETKQFFTMMTLHMLCKCTQEFYTVCSSEMVLKAAGEQNFLIELLLGNIYIELKKCKRLILNESFRPVWIR
jgi:hypothetical protein